MKILIWAHIKKFDWIPFIVYRHLTLSFIALGYTGFLSQVQNYCLMSPDLSKILIIAFYRRELIAAYYITFVLFVLLANLVYYTEHMETNPGSFFVNSSEVSGIFVFFSKQSLESQIKTLAHAWWFSVVSITTIG